LMLNNTFTKQQLDQLTKESSDWMISHGMMLNKKTMQLTHAPVTLCPSQFPRSLFEFSYRLTPLFQTLVHRISCDMDYCEFIGSK